MPHGVFLSMRILLKLEISDGLLKIRKPSMEKSLKKTNIINNGAQMDMIIII